MAQNKHRAQILLETEQHQALAEVARSEQRSISELVREIVRDWLDQQDERRTWEKRMDTLQRLNQIRENIEEGYGVYQGDLVEEARTDREQEDERTWRGEG